MGIEGFTGILLSSLPQKSKFPYLYPSLSLKNLKQRSSSSSSHSKHIEHSQFNHIFFDVNNFLYKPVNNEAHLQILLRNNLLTYIRGIQPTGISFLGMDGPGPRAKMQLQQGRRVCLEDPHGKVQHLTQFEQIKHQLSLERQRKKLKRFSSIHPGNFTPGTMVMNRLSDSLLRVVMMAMSDQSVMNSDTADTSSPKGRGGGHYLTKGFVVSDSNRFNEGEYKMFEYMKHYTRPDDVHCVVSGDADAILYGLQQRNGTIYVEREGEVYSIVNLRKTIAEELGTETEEQLDQVVNDFCFLFLLVGNDYSPALRFFSFQKSWKAYQRYKKANPNESLIQFPHNSWRYVLNMKFMRSLVQDTTINVSTISANVSFRSIFSNFVMRYLRMESKIYTTQTNDEYHAYLNPKVSEHPRLTSIRGRGATVKEAEMDLLNRVERDDILFECMRDKFPSITRDTHNQMIQSIFTTGETTQPEVASEEAVHSFFTSVGLSMRIFRAETPNHSFYYKYDPISISDIMKVKSDQLVFNLPFDNSLPLFPAEFCLALTPYNNRDMLPQQELRELMMPESPLADLYHGTPEELAERWNEPDSVSRLRNEVAKKTQNRSVGGLQFSKNILFRTTASPLSIGPVVPTIERNLRCSVPNLLLSQESDYAQGAPYSRINPFGTQRLSVPIK